MSYKPFNTNRAILALAVAIVFYLVYLLLAYFVTEHYRSTLPAMKPFEVSFLNVFYPSLLLCEVFIYRWLRNKYIIRKYANLHIWSVLVKMVILTPCMVLLAFLLPYYFSKAAFAEISTELRWFVFWGGNSFFLIGHIFLILVILQRNKWPSQRTATANDELQEFEDH